VQESEKFVNSRVYRIRELKYAVRIFKGAKGVAMTTKFRQNMRKLYIF